MLLANSSWIMLSLIIKQTNRQTKTKRYVHEYVRVLTKYQFIHCTFEGGKSEEKNGCLLSFSNLNFRFVTQIWRYNTHFYCRFYLGNMCCFLSIQWTKLDAKRTSKSALGTTLVHGHLPSLDIFLKFFRIGIIEKVYDRLKRRHLTQMSSPWHYSYRIEGLWLFLKICPPILEKLHCGDI